MKPHNQARSTVRSLAAASLVIVASCSATNRGPSWFDGSPDPITPELVNELDESQRETIRDARMEAAQAEDRVADARVSVDEARELQKIAVQQVEIAKQELKLAEVRKAGSAKNDVIEASSKRESNAVDEVQLAERRVEIFDALIMARRDGVKAAEAEAELAEARVELARARAAAELDRADADEIDVREYQVWTRGLEADAEVAKARHDASIREFRVLREEFEGELARFPEMKKDFSDLLEKVEEGQD